MQRHNRDCRRPCRGAALLMALLLSAGLSSPIIGEAQTGGPNPEAAEKARQAELKRLAADSLWRLKRAIRRDQYPSGRVNLNVWRVTAKDAGTYDPALDQELTERIYKDAIDETLSWLDYSLSKGWLNDADYCRRVYRIRATEIGWFDADFYETLGERIEARRAEIRDRKAAAEP